MRRQVLQHFNEADDALRFAQQHHPRRLHALATGADKRNVRPKCAECTGQGRTVQVTRRLTGEDQDLTHRHRSWFLRALRWR